jgi:hypothetical protein
MATPSTTRIVAKTESAGFMAIATEFALAARLALAKSLKKPRFIEAFEALDNQW